MPNKETWPKAYLLPSDRANDTDWKIFQIHVDAQASSSYFADRRQRWRPIFSLKGSLDLRVEWWVKNNLRGQRKTCSLEAFGHSCPNWNSTNLCCRPHPGSVFPRFAGARTGGMSIVINCATDGQDCFEAVRSYTGRLLLDWKKESRRPDLIFSNSELHGWN